MAKPGYVTMDFVTVDGTRIRANAGKTFAGDIRESKEKRTRIEQKMEQILAYTVDEELSERYAIRKQNELDSLQKEREKINAFLATLGGQGDAEHTAKTK